MPSGRQMPFRGLGKFVLVAVVAGAIGAAIGVGLAHMTSIHTTTVGVAPVLTPPAVPSVVPPAPAQAPPPATSTPTSPAPTTVPTTTPAPTTTATPAATTAVPLAGSKLVPRVQIASAIIGKQSTTTQHARVTATVTVTNRYGHALALTSPVLVSGSDQTPLDPAARSLAEPLLTTLAPGQSATGSLRFTVAGDVATRLIAAPRAQLKIAGRTVVLKLTTTPG